MKKTISIILLSIIFIIALSLNFNNFAATGSFSLSKSSVTLEKGKTTTFSIKLSNCEGKFSIASSNTKVAKVSSSEEWITGSTTITITAIGEGTATITVTAIDVGDTDEQEVSGWKSIKVKVNDSSSNTNSTGNTTNSTTNETTNNTTNNNNTSNGNTTTEKPKEPEVSTDATLKNLGITPKEYDFSGFKPGTLSYSVEVPNDVEKISIYAYAKDTNAIVTGTGSKTLKEGANTYSVKVTAEDKKTTKTYKLTITRKAKTEDTEDPKEEKPEEEPTEQENNTEATGLTNLEVAGYTLNPGFSPNIYEYTLDLTEKVEKLDIKTETSDGITIDIAGNEELKVGENVITLLVYNSKEETTETYQIIANIPKENASTTAGAIQDIDNSLSEAQKEYNNKQMIIAGIIIAIILLLIIFLIVRQKIRKNAEYDDEEQSRLDLNEEDDFFKRINSREEMPKVKKEEINNDVVNSENINTTKSQGSQVEELKEIRRNIREDKELDNFEKMDNLEEILRARKSKGRHF